MIRLPQQTPHQTAQPSEADRAVCYVCFKPLAFCICKEIKPVDNRTRVVIVQHKCERAHPIGTALIAKLALKNTKLKVVWPDQENKFTFRPQDMMSPGLLYPGPEAIDLATVPAAQRPGELLVLDGTWNDVRKLYKDNPWLAQMPQYRLNPTVPSRYRIRKEPNEQSISTIEAIVQALEILEPETPGLPMLITAFEAMIDRQIEHIRIRPPMPATHRTKRRRNRARRSIPGELQGSLKNLVIVDGESVPWKGKKRSLVRWFAFRIHDGSVFDQFVMPRGGSTLTNDHLDRMGLCREDMEPAVSSEELERRWNEFITPDDILVTWNKGVLDQLGRMVKNRQRSFFLKEAWCNSQGGKCGHLKDLVRDRHLTLSAIPIKGRAARYLAETLAVARYLSQPPQTTSDSEAAEDTI